MPRSKANVMLVASSLHIGGAEQVIETLCEHLDKDSFRVTVCHLAELGVVGKELRRRGHDVVGMGGSGPRYLSSLWLRSVARKKRIHLLHSHTTYALIDSTVARRTTPGMKSVHTFHFGNYPHYVPRYMFIERILARFADRLVAVGLDQKSRIKDAYGLDDSRLETIRNGVEQPLPTSPPSVLEPVLASGRPVVATVSSLIEQKGISHLLEVARILRSRGRDCIFLVVGDGPLRERLEAETRSLGLEESVVFVGWIRRASTFVLPYADIFFQPSLWEATSLVVLEAMAAGKPLVVTDVGDNRYLVENEKGGLVVPPGSVEDMAAALARLLDDQALRKTLGEAAKRSYWKDCTAEAMTRNYEKLYREVLRIA